jgi:hypothetical protein
MAKQARSEIAGMIRSDMAEEASAGFPLLMRFPNSETMGIPGYFSRLSPADRDALLGALAHFSTVQWSHDIVREKKAHKVLGPFLARQPTYPAGDWYGDRPRKTQLKKAVMDELTRAGYVRSSAAGNRPSDVVELIHPDRTFSGYLLLSFDPGFPRQLDFGFRNWLHPSLCSSFPPLGPRDFIPILHSLTYDHLWHGAGTNNPICWDVITESNLDKTVIALREALDRLTALAGRINHLAASCEQA